MLPFFARFLHAAETHALKTCVRRCGSKPKPKPIKVALVGAAGGIGAPCLMLMKMNSLIKELSAIDVSKTVPGVAMDVWHMNFPAKVTGYVSPGDLKAGLCNADLVLITAGLPRKEGMSRDDLFKSNANIIKSTAEAIAASCPEAIVLIVTNPVNSVVPVFCQVMESKGCLNPNKVIGVTTLDNVRAAMFVGCLKDADPREVCIPVICGHSGETIIPLFSQVKAKKAIKLNQTEIDALTKKVQDAGTDVVKAKAGAGSATLSMAYSAARCVNSFLRAMNGEKDVVECGYVKADFCGLPYFATPLVLGPCGVEKNLGIPEMSSFEKGLVEKGVKALAKNIKTGEDFGKALKCS